jgi:hypothetical protein
MSPLAPFWLATALYHTIVYILLFWFPSKILWTFKLILLWTQLGILNFQPISLRFWHIRALPISQLVKIWLIWFTCSRKNNSFMRQTNFFVWNKSLLLSKNIGSLVFLSCAYFQFNRSFKSLVLSCAPKQENLFSSKLSWNSSST